jgi:hypothetical protein
MWEWLKSVATRFAQLLEGSFTALPGKWLAVIAVVVLALFGVLLLSLVQVVPHPQTPGETYLKTDTALGWYGVALGVFGFWYTASQLYLTKRESVAAKEAAEAATKKAEETIQELRDEAEQTHRVLVAQAEAESYCRQIEGALAFVDEAVTLAAVKPWKIAGMRLRDAGRQLREIQATREHADDRWRNFARDLEQYADQLLQSARDTQRLPDDFPAATWGPLTDAVRSALIGERRESDPR